MPLSTIERMDFAVSAWASLPDDDDGPLSQILSDIVDDAIDALMDQYEVESAD